MTDRSAWLDNPYPFYARLRESGLPFWLEHQQDTSSPGVWLLSRYSDTLALFKQSQTVSKNIRSIRQGGRVSPFDLHLLFRDGEDHIRLRRLVSSYFSMQATSAMELHALSAAALLIDQFRDLPNIDLIRDFAEPLPMLVIARMMGIATMDLPMIRRWSLVLGDSFDSTFCAPGLRESGQQAMREFMGYVASLIEERRKHPGGQAEHDLLGFLIGACNEGRLSQDELLGMAGFLLFAGHETTVNLIGNGLWLLLTHPESWSELKRQPGLMPLAIEEILRMESPEQRTSFRIVLEPFELAGHFFEPGTQIGAILGAANRDPAQFSQPDIFDIRRDPNSHLAFGLGIHHCLGKFMARMEANVALSEIMKRCPNLGLVSADPVWRPNSFFRGLASLPAVMSA